VKVQVKSTAKSIVYEAKVKGREALYRVSEFLGIKNKLLNIRENVRGAIRTTDKDIAKTALLGKGLREAGQTAANAFRTFADKLEVDYSQKEQKHTITKAVLAPMKAVNNVLVSMELHLDASIDKLDNLAMNVQIDKEKRMENTKSEEQNVPDREEAESERVNAEIVYVPMVAEAHEYQYNADAFEARGGADVKVGTAEKVSKVREDKAR
jgi:seryl-tRNA synthetase